MKKSSNGSPTNTIQGTNAIVRMNVLWYNGNSDNNLPKKNRNNVMDG
ncbi:hypothetical protein [Dyadobacter diqingensis]|nr:hypothetical protein [Dyadobacter diqingensis]